MEEKIMEKKYVWYASYGSNMLEERFMCYIKGGYFAPNDRHYDGCKDKTPPLDSMPVIIPYEMYYGQSSPSWQDSGVSFIDTDVPGHSLGRMYLITEEQFKDIHKAEGPSACWYDLVVNFGEFDGHPLMTFTNSTRREENEPSKEYLKVIQMGVSEMFPALKLG